MCHLLVGPRQRQDGYLEKQKIYESVNPRVLRNCACGTSHLHPNKSEQESLSASESYRLLTCFSSGDFAKNKLQDVDIINIQITATNRITIYMRTHNLKALTIIKELQAKAIRREVIIQIKFSYTKELQSVSYTAPTIRYRKQL